MSSPIFDSMSRRCVPYASAARRACDDCLKAAEPARVTFTEIPALITERELLRPTWELSV